MGTLPRVAVILAGGEGRRLWPASTPRRPKQFLRLFGGRTLLEATWERARAVPGVDDIWVVTGRPYAELTRQALPGLPPGRLLVEPSGKNTAPALALAAGHIAREHGDAAVLVLPADHYIPDREAFAASAARALEVAAAGEALVTFGIQPTRPETHYGYIELEVRRQREEGSPGAGGSSREPATPERGPAGNAPAAVSGAGGAGGTPVEAAGDGAGDAAPGPMDVLPVRRFVEKPDAARAVEFLAAGHYLWNSGMFAWRNGTFLAELARVAPELHRLATRVAAGGDWHEEWERVPSISVDYAVMEKARRILCVRAGFAWDDLGSWLAVERHGEADGQGNVVLGTAPAILRAASGVTVLAEQVPAVVLGVRDLVLAATRDGVLVAGKDSLDGLREALAALEQALAAGEPPAGAGVAARAAAGAAARAAAEAAAGEALP